MYDFTRVVPKYSASFLLNTSLGRYSGARRLYSRLTNPCMEKRTQPFLDRFTATQGRPRTFQVVTVIIVLFILTLAITGIVRLLFFHAV